MGAQKFMGAQKLLTGHDASASLRHPQMAPELSLSQCIVREPATASHDKTTYRAICYFCLITVSHEFVIRTQTEV